VKEIIDGVIKYDRSQFTKTNALIVDEYKDLEYWRRKLFDLKLIGEYAEFEVGYGNLSQKKNYSQVYTSDKAQFLITGTQTGKFQNLDGSQYTRVVDFNIEKLIVKVNGPLEASSEALTHAAIYKCQDKINAIFHIHDSEIWKNMLGANCNRTAKEIPYGTFEMAVAVKECIGNSTSGYFVMAGHEDGVVAYGTNLEECGNIILDLYKKFK
jgi:hypothetical protein